MPPAWACCASAPGRPSAGAVAWPAPTRRWGACWPGSGGSSEETRTCARVHGRTTESGGCRHRPADNAAVRSPMRQRSLDRRRARARQAHRQCRTEIGKMFELVENEATNAAIKVVGVGGGGGNAVAHMLDASVDGVEFIAMNTDAQALKRTSAKVQLQLGPNVTKGLGAGANPEVGRQAALEDRERITEVLKDADMVFITAGMGGGTGTGAAPVVAQLAKEMGILTVAVVTRPFPFEGRRRMQVAHKGIEELSQYVDSLITVPNEKLLSVLGREVSLI